MMWVLNQSDGTRDLLEIAEMSTVSFDELSAAAESLLAAGLLKRLN
jgi:aminopeptidase-like protein